MILYDGESSINFKFYNLKTSYANYFTKEMEKELHQLVGETLNNLPFISSFINGNTTKLLNVINTGEVVEYLFDYTTEKIVFKDSLPYKIVTHHKIHCRHYISKHIVAIIPNEGMKDEVIVSIITLIPYYLQLQLFSGEIPGYKKPKFEEVNFTNEEMASIGYMMGDIMKNNFMKPICYKGLCEKIIAAEDSKGAAIMDAKPYRKHSFMIRNKIEDKKQMLLLNAKGEVKIECPFPEEVLDNLVNLIYLRKYICTSLPLFSPVHAIIDEYLDFLQADMYEEGKRRQKRRILQEFAELISSEKHGKEETLDISYTAFTMGFNILAKMPLHEKIVEEPTENYAFSHENISQFIAVYRKNAYGAKLKEREINSLFHSFMQIMELYKTDKKALLQSLRDRTI